MNGGLNVSLGVRATRAGRGESFCRVNLVNADLIQPRGSG